MVGDGLRLVSIGAVLGLGAALAVSRAIEQQLFGVRPLDPATYAGVALVLVAVALTRVSGSRAQGDARRSGGGATKRVRRKLSAVSCQLSAQSLLKQTRRPSSCFADS